MPAKKEPLKRAKAPVKKVAKKKAPAARSNEDSFVTACVALILILSLVFFAQAVYKYGL